MTDRSTHPIGYLWHKRFADFVPVMEINLASRHVVWDDGQESRTIPPDREYEIDNFDVFDWSVDPDHHGHLLNKHANL